MNKSKKTSDILGYLDPRDSSSNEIIEIENQRDFYTSARFSDKDQFLENLVSYTFTNETSTSSPKELDTQEKKLEDVFPIAGTDFVYFSKWKNIENISARLVEKFDDTIVLECLIDKESGVYEEREFRISLFEGYDLTIGNFFFLRYFERQNEARLEIHDNPELTLASDFPKRDFSQLFKESKLFKK